MLLLLLCMTSVLHFSTCDVVQFCQGANQCSLCTVTGPTVIDISGQVKSVPDRCLYSLMKTSSVPGFQVKAHFKDRRRKDVSFLDSVILSLDVPDVDISLGQGGTVKLGDTEMTNMSSPVHGVELFKDQTGVTAKISNSNNTMTVFFDGYTAQIHIKGPSGPALTVEGLCGNSSSISNERLSSESQNGCETQYQEPDNSTISCQTSTARCDLLKVAPFTNCQSNISPQPYITACSTTLCRYPAVDGLKCQFLKAYVKACSLYSNDTLGGWSSAANCSADLQAFCQDRFCSVNEFCGDNNNNGTRCHCRAIFAEPYRTANSFADPVVCNGTSRSVTLVGCLLEDRGISYSDLHLYDKTCKADLDQVTHMVTLGFDSKTNPCGTVLKMNNNSEVIKKNAIILDPTNEELNDFTCPFVIPDISIDFSVSIKVKEGSGSTAAISYVSNGLWQYTLTMKAYTNRYHTQAVSSDTPLHLNQRVWFELKADGLNDKLVNLVTESCFATNEQSPDSNLTYSLINNGCPNSADNTVIMESNGVGTTNFFSFKMFKFSGRTGDVWLHCRMRLCSKAEGDACVPDCNQNNRKRRSVTSKYKEENPAVIIMSWST